MPLKPKSPGTPPKGMRWTYKNVEDNFEIQHLHYDILKSKVRDYRRLNNYPVGSNFDSDFDANVCSNADGNDCFDDSTPPLARRAVKFAKAMVSWAGSGFPTRSKEEVERIMEICHGCEYFSGENSPFKVSCKKCGCSSLQAYVSTKHCPIQKW